MLLLVSFALHHLLSLNGIKSEIIYVNTIEKLNSKTMMGIFEIEMAVKNKNFKSDPNDYIILIDSQIGNSNITNLRGNNLAVIDHHKDMHSNQYLYKDVQEDIGACSTIIAEYYREAGIKPTVNVATALLYGIMNDTNNLTRGNNFKDLDNFYWLYQIADFTKIKQLRMNEIGRDDLIAYAKALECIEIYGNIAFVHIEDCNDSLLGTISDLVYTIEGISIVVSYATRYNGVKFSIRSGEDHISADDLVLSILNNKGVGGGHKEMAGGFIPSEELEFLNYKELDTYVRYRSIMAVEQALV